MQFIDADKLMEFAKKHANGSVDCNDIARLPRVDAVPVVRCKDCKWYDSVFFGCTKSRFFPDPDFFCACGEKRDGGETHAAD